ncbi:uncharacterized protein G2W53_042881 [Senna tora]|uniref:Uncharacterized protein n=1 Tax=Senna tora TaxID=362788 RepID=A0A834SG17_9FABA|nr:uncharacterized protein G2W53_042881 [Senna tora]
MGAATEATAMAVEELNMGWYTA